MHHIGKIHIANKLNDGGGARVTHKMLANTVDALFKMTKEYHEQASCLQLCFRERQISPLFAAAFREFTPVFLGEAPIRRRDDNRCIAGARGWVDYWLIYRNSTYFIEIKHGYISCKSANTNGLKAKWDTAKNQLHSTKRDLCKKWSNTEHSFAVSIMVVPFFVAGGATYKKHISHEAIDRCHRALLKLNPEPNWSALCYLEDQYIGPYQYENSTEYHPAIGIYALVQKSM